MVVTVKGTRTSFRHAKTFPYEVPECILDMRDKYQKRVIADKKFQERLCQDPKIGLAFKYQVLKHYNSVDKIPERFKWENVDNAIRAYIIDSLDNHALLANLVSCEFGDHVKYIKSQYERERVRKDIRNQLKRAMHVLKAFRSTDESLDEWYDRLRFEYRLCADISVPLVNIIE